MPKLSFDFVSSNADSVRAMPRARRELGHNDTNVIIVFCLFMLAVLVLGPYISKFIAAYQTQMPEKTVEWAVTIGIAIGGGLLIAPWARRQLKKRLDRVSLDLPTHLSVGEEGIRITDELSETFWRWPRVHRAVIIPEGVLILSGSSTYLVPAPGLQEDQQRALVDFINARASSKVARLTAP